MQNQDKQEAEAINYKMAKMFFEYRCLREVVEPRCDDANDVNQELVA